MNIPLLIITVMFFICGSFLIVLGKFVNNSQVEMNIGFVSLGVGMAFLIYFMIITITDYFIKR
jgi:VIT1/CCC1 family predicted Fe2+/Mn2+ transporter